MVTVRVREDAKIGLEGSFGRFRRSDSGMAFAHPLFERPHHPSPGAGPYHATVRQRHVTKKVDALPELSKADFPRMQYQPESIQQERLEGRQQRTSGGGIPHCHGEVISVPGVPAKAQPMLHELVKLVHVHIREQLRCQISDRQSRRPGSFAGRRVAAHDFIQQPHRHFVVDRSAQDRQQDAMINACEESVYIALEHVAHPRSVLPSLSQHSLERIHGFVRPLPPPARERVRDESAVKDRLQDANDRMMNEAVADTRLVNPPLLGIGNRECRVRTMAVLPRRKFSVKRENVLLQSPLELLDITSSPFSASELLPRREQVLWRDDARKDTLVPFVVMDQFDVPIFQRAYDLYKAIYAMRSVVAKQDRHTLWQRVENMSLHIIECFLLAGEHAHNERCKVLRTASSQLNLLRVLLRLCRDNKVIDLRRYAQLQQSIDEIGRMLGGWIKSLADKSKPTHRGA